jgi:predicted transglutaminase-like cysteine proteinase
MSRCVRFCLCVVLFVTVFAFEVSARPNASSTNSENLPSIAPEMTDARSEIAPIAFFRFCLSNQEQCSGSDTRSRITLTRDNWLKLQEVNDTVNARIRPDASKGAFDWSTETAHGNCNDYAVQKQKALFELGFPKSALALTTAQTQIGVGHLVVTVRTDRGDFVLDNLRTGIVAWNRTGYRWIARQSMANPRQWVSLSTVSASRLATNTPKTRFEPKTRVQQPARRFQVSDLGLRQLNISSFGVVDGIFPQAKHRRNVVSVFPAFG